MPIDCPVCRHVNRDTARFCGHCGGALSSSASQPAPAPTPPFPSIGPTQTGLLVPSALLVHRYRIVRKIGQGGMGAVYQVEDMRLANKVWAVKELSDAAITDPLEKQRAASGFLREADLLAGLEHPNIPAVTDSFSVAGRFYLVMEYVDGETLEALLQARGQPFAESEVRIWLAQLGSALAFLHGQQKPIIFRDLKPANIMLDRQDRIKLIDFGIARTMQPGKKKDTTLLGTEGYAPPEQYGQAGAQTDARSDIYALGATLLRLLTGYDPATSPFKLPGARDLNPKVSPEMARVIARALELESKQRWQNVGKLVAALSIPLAQPTAPKPAPKPAPPPKPAPAQVPTKAGAVAPVAPAVPVVQASTRPTTRLLMSARQLSTRQALAIVFGFGFASIAGLLIFGPILRAQFPTLWANIPGYLIVGPMAYAATRRPGAALATQLPLTVVGLGAWWLRTGQPFDLWELLVASTVSSLLLAAGCWLVPKLQGAHPQEAWQREIAWFGVLGAATALTFTWLSPSEAAGFIWLGGALMAILGWFLGDLVQQWQQLRLSGDQRPAGP